MDLHMNSYISPDGSQFYRLKLNDFATLHIDTHTVSKFSLTYLITLHRYTTVWERVLVLGTFPNCTYSPPGTSSPTNRCTPSLSLSPLLSVLAIDRLSVVEWEFRNHGKVGCVQLLPSLSFTGIWRIEMRTGLCFKVKYLRTA